MKLNKIMMAAMLAFGATSMAHAAEGDPSKDQGHGQIHFKGHIVDAPCSIKPGEDGDGQTVYLGQISNAVLAANGNTGTSSPRPFQITLENCAMGTLKSVKTKFTGPTSKWDQNNLGMTGTADGASIVLTDGTGKKTKLGEASAAQQLQNGNNTLSFSAYLQGGGKDAVIVPGEFSSIADFTLAYE
ncbi:fimbria A protein [Enterobacterales bacterium CwR94]|nr:fimbria A protein [Enterobacterales bacterium CwR94]